MNEFVEAAKKKAAEKKNFAIKCEMKLWSL